MQQIKQLMLRMGNQANLEEGIMTGEMADAHIQSYLNHGYKLFAVNPGGIDQGTSSISIHYVLTLDNDELHIGMDVSRAQDQIDEMVGEIDGNSLKWRTPEEASVSA